MATYPVYAICGGAAGHWGTIPGLTPMTDHEITREFVEDLRRRVERAFNERAPRVIEEVLADGLIDHNILLGGVDLRQRMARVKEAFDDAGCPSTNN